MNVAMTVVPWTTASTMLSDDRGTYTIDPTCPALRQTTGRMAMVGMCVGALWYRVCMHSGILVSRVGVMIQLRI